MLLFSKSAAFMLRNITCGTAMLYNAQGVIMVQSLNLMPDSLFNVGSERECDAGHHAHLENRSGLAAHRERNGVRRDGERRYRAEHRSRDVRRADQCVLAM